MGERVVHFVFGFRAQREPFHVLHHLALASCRNVVNPDRILFHYDELPYGRWWDRTRPFVELCRVARVPEVDGWGYDEAIVARYRYAHHADVVRLDAMLEHGGMYADVDTVFVAPVPDELWDAPFVLGREAPVRDERGVLAPSLSNALMLGRPGSAFAARWREQILGAHDGSWTGHSCRLAQRLADEHPDDVRIEPQRSFSLYDHTVASVRELLDGPPPADLDGVYSVHLLAHLWFEAGRRDFSDLHAGVITEAYLREAPTALAALARPHLGLRAHG